MNIAQIANNLQQLVKTFHAESFIYDLLLAYGQPRASIKRMQEGGLNLSKVEGEIAWKKKLFFKAVHGEDLHELIADLTKNGKALKHDPRFVVLTDYTHLLAIDTKTKDTLDIAILDIAKHFDFFLPWAGMEKAQYQNENPADVKAAEKMAKLYDDIKKDNPTTTSAEVHNLNVFLSRLLFCFFAEDTGIFEKSQFTNAISSHTQQDGSDLNTYLDTLFEVMNTEQSKRTNLPNYLNAFPYVNGGLFRNKHTAPTFTRKSRQTIIDCGELDWSAINPDIFGSMIQAVITPEHRGGLGMHYTSVPNIMKVIEPLFLNELYEEFEAATSASSVAEKKKKLNKLLQRLWNIKIFDPACGSGNFLIIAYKELRKLEMKIFKAMNILDYSEISLGNFYGIELDDFAHEVAILSLWLAEHQMNQVFFKEFGRTKPALPLTETGNIVHGNATRLDWEIVCPKTRNGGTEPAEVYVLGNPPYLGSRRQDDIQKADLKIIFGEDYKSLDYIAAWFYNGAKYIEGFNSKCAFVSTNSICQGEQVSLVWKRVLQKEIEIGFAHKDFKWSNNAKSNAAVIVIIVGLQNKNQGNRYIFNSGIKANVTSINPYLVEGKTLYIHTKQNTLSDLPEMNFGNMPADGGKLLFTPEEKNEFISKEPNSKKYFSKLISAFEFLNGRERHCLWLEDCDKKEMESMPLVKKLVSELKHIRKESSRPQLAEIPHLFAQITQPKDKDFIVIPRHSSENREYIPIGFFNSENKAHDSCLIVPTNEHYLFAVLTSKIHMCWVQSVAGRIKTDFRYSKDVVYNNFPFPPITDIQKKELEKHVYNVLAEREAHSEKTLAQLYDPDKMPDGLREAHHQLDLAVERCYRDKPFETDEERLAYLFKLYELMIAEEKSKGTLFEIEAKPKKKKK
jgi:hypothetical protein